MSPRRPTHKRQDPPRGSKQGALRLVFPLHQETTPSFLWLINPWPLSQSCSFLSAGRIDWSFLLPAQTSVFFSCEESRPCWVPRFPPSGDRSNLQAFSLLRNFIVRSLFFFFFTCKAKKGRKWPGPPFMSRCL